MYRLTIDNQAIDVPAGATILDAAETAGVRIPTLCFLRRGGISPCTSCFVCVVKVAGRAALAPACATAVEDGMVVESDSDEVRAARRTALELLLSDHVGDCQGPCQTICPARMNIPRMIRQIAAGDLRGAIETVKADIALPAVLGRICPAPCEKGCRRKLADAAVSIMRLKRFVADADLASPQPHLPPRQPATGKRVAIVGAGPAGLAAAYYLLQSGHACTLFDEHAQPGGMLRYGVDEQALPRDVLDAEIDVIHRLGATFQLGDRVTDLAALRAGYDAVALAVGKLAATEAGQWGLGASADGMTVDEETLATSLPGVFAGGDAVRPQRLTVRAVADGKTMAAAVDQFLAGRTITGRPRSFNCRMGTMKAGELDIFLAGASREPRVELSFGQRENLSRHAQAEAARCLHCDCRRADDCTLRREAERYCAQANRFKNDRRVFQQQRHPRIVYESGKCIRCGLCVQIAAAAGEKLGLTFLGRGYDVRVGVPFDRPLDEALAASAEDCARACPTGAISMAE